MVLHSSLVQAVQRWQKYAYRTEVEGANLTQKRSSSVGSGGSGPLATSDEENKLRLNC
jgi:hypothetical protein